MFNMAMVKIPHAMSNANFDLPEGTTCQKRVNRRELKDKLRLGSEGDLGFSGEDGLGAGVEDQGA